MTTLKFTPVRWVADAAAYRHDLPRSERRARYLIVRDACKAAGVEVRTYFDTEAAAEAFARDKLRPIVGPLGIEPGVFKTFALVL